MAACGQKLPEIGMAAHREVMLCSHLHALLVEACATGTVALMRDLSVSMPTPKDFCGETRV